MVKRFPRALTLLSRDTDGVRMLDSVVDESVGEIYLRAL